jgi:hypothetical protein
MSTNLNGLTGLAGLTQVDNDDAFATPEERHGGTVDPLHTQWGEQAEPYSWVSQAMPAASHGPYGAENELLSDAEFWMFEAPGTPQEDPLFDWNMPTVTRSHGAPHNVTLSGPIPGTAIANGQIEAVQLQLSQMGNHGSDLGTSKNMTHDQLGYAQQDNWQEIWEINPGDTMNEPLPRQAMSALPQGGFGQTDRTASFARQNEFGFDSKHQHRRYTEVSLGHLPGNYQWLIPQGRPLHRNLPGPARPPIGIDSQFTDQDLGFAFGYNSGAILQATPEAYVPPPTPNINTATPTYDDPNGTSGFDMW